MPILDEVRITELPGADPLAGPELIPLVQDGVTKSRSAQNLVLDGGLQDHLDAADPHDQYAFRVLNNLTSNVDPVVTNDSSEGYSVLSKWLNNVTAEVWLCLDATVGAAIWDIKTLTTDDLGSAALANVGAGNGLDADTLDGIDSLGFDAAGAADTAVSDHVALPDPHSQYADQANTYTETEVDSLLDDKAAIAGQVFTGDIEAPGITATGSFTSPGIDDNATSTAITIDASENVGLVLLTLSIN